MHMNNKEEKELTGIGICDLSITPAFKQAGWEQMQRIRREVTLTPGSVLVRGKISSRNRKKPGNRNIVLGMKWLFSVRKHTTSRC